MCLVGRGARRSQRASWLATVVVLGSALGCGAGHISSEGQPCDSTRPCASPLVCVDHQCVQPQGDGAAGDGAAGDGAAGDGAAGDGAAGDGAAGDAAAGDTAAPVTGDGGEADGASGPCPGSGPVTTFLWDDSVYPDMTGAFSGTPTSECSYDTPLVTNSTGAPPFSDFGFDGWRAASCYDGAYTSVDTSAGAPQRHAGQPSIHFVLEPFDPAVPQCEDSGLGDAIGAANYRSEIYFSTSQYGDVFPADSEIWLSWSYYFPALDYVHDSYCDSGTGDSAEGCIHQIYTGAVGTSPIVELWSHGCWGNKLVISLNNSFTDAHYLPDPGTGAPNTTGDAWSFVAGTWLDFVEHVIFSSDPGTGVYELWIKDVGTGEETKLITYHGETSSYGYGGTIKLGFYHYYWHSTSTQPALNSAGVGTTRLESYLGPVRLEYNPAGSYNPDGKCDVQP